MSAVTIRAALSEEQALQRISMKNMISQVTGIPFGRINDHIFYNEVTKIVHEQITNGKREELLQRFKDAYTKD